MAETARSSCAPGTSPTGATCRPGRARPRRRKLLREMCAVMTQDDPDIVLLQEVPVWAAALLREHTGMGVTLAHAYGAHIPFVHVPLPLAAGAAARPGAAGPRAHPVRGPGPGAPLRPGPAAGLGPPGAAERAHRWLRGEPRIAQLVRLRHRRLGVELAVANVHADPRGGADAAREGGVRARAVRPRRADDPGRRPERRHALGGRARAASAGAGSRMPARSGSTICWCAAPSSSGRRRGGSRSAATCA